MLAGTDPVRLAVMPVPSTSAGITSVRSRATVSSVTASWGDVVGMIRKMNASEAGGSARSLGNGSDTESTPGSWAITARNDWIVSRSSGPSTCMARMNGPL